MSNTQIATFTADGYSSLEFHYVSGNSFQIGGFGTTVVDPGALVDFSVPVELVDADGDIVGSAINISLLPNDGSGVQDHSEDAAGGALTRQ